MADPFSIVNQVTREELLSGDLVNAQTLASAQNQDLLRDDGRTDESRSSAAFYVPTSPGSPAYGASLLPTATAGGGFTLSVSEGQGFFDTGGAATLNSGDSTYEVVRWAAQVVSFAAPDPTNPRVDLVYAAPGTAQDDIQSRNILLDPVARTVAPALVPKRVNPSALLITVTGTPASLPTAPALPAGGLPVFEVFVPAAAASAASFQIARQLNRRCTFPMSSAHGIIQGVQLTSNFVNEATTSSNMAIGFSNGSGASKVAIDGEVIAFDGGDGLFGPLNLLTQDAGGNNPFAAPAPANSDKPYYIYACGGRHLRQGRNGFTALGAQAYFPICFVESLVVPTLDGRPSANITTPRGVTQAGALYVGIGFVVRNSARRKVCSWAGDWVYAVTGQMNPGVITGSNLYAGFNEVNTRTLTAGPDTFTLAAAPAVSTRANLGFVYSNTALEFLSVGRIIAGQFFSQAVMELDSTNQFGIVDVDITSAKTVDVANSGGFGASSFSVWGRGYNMNVKRLTAAI